MAVKLSKDAAWQQIGLSLTRKIHRGRSIILSSGSRLLRYSQRYLPCELSTRFALLLAWLKSWSGSAPRLP
jgi:hypothetical protein